MSLHTELHNALVCGDEQESGHWWGPTEEDELKELELAYSDSAAKAYRRQCLHCFKKERMLVLSPKVFAPIKQASRILTE